MIKGYQVKAARAILGWTRDNLADASGVYGQTILNFENGNSVPRMETVKQLVSALERNGIEFIDDGVRLVKQKIVPLEGKNWFNDILEDACLAFANSPEEEKELMIFSGDNRVSPPEVINLFRRIRGLGVRFREMVEEGNTFMMGPVEEYRWIPKNFYKNNIIFLYLNRIVLDMGNTGVFIESKEISNTMRNQFDLLWEVLPALEIESTASVRY